MIQNNYETTCPSYDDLLALGWDNSNQVISGAFIFEDNMTQRDKPKLINHYRFYDFAKEYLFFIDTPSDMRDRIKTITIENNMDSYVGSQQFKKIDDVRFMSVNRYVDSQCKHATIHAGTWKEVLPDTIEYLRHGCDEKFSNIQTVIEFHDNVTVMSNTNTDKYRQDEFVRYVKENCIFEYGKC